ncbi:hypothetical protein ACHAXT_010247 [Thalassiosira profunda]
MHLTAALLLAGIASCAAFAGPRTYGAPRAPAALNAERSDANEGDAAMTRRETLAKSLMIGVGAFGTLTSEAGAFPNKISNQYDDRPKQRGSKPKGLGVAMRKNLAGEEYLGLKECGAAPNCFCSNDNIEDSPDTNIPPFKWPASKFSSREEAFQQLHEVVQAYQPGQSNIDGGGFEIVTFDPKSGYIYAQFESLKAGYIDDLELAFVDDGKDSNAVQVRSSSRLGYLDFGVNAKRINFIAKGLREKGWDAPGVLLETHRGYAEENGVKSL